MNNVLFIAIPRTAGTSIIKALIKSGGMQIRKHRFIKDFHNKGIISFGHFDVKVLTKEGVISQEYLDSAFKFCFIRNPWDRLVSLYNYYRYGKAARTRGEMTKRKVWGQKSFREFCLDLYEEDIDPIGFYNVEGLSQCNNQLDWIVDSSGKVFVDFIGRFENLAEDLVGIGRRIGLDLVLYHKNRMRHKYYQEHYSGEDTDLVEVVGKIYRKDIEHFGYKF